MGEVTGDSAAQLLRLRRVLIASGLAARLAGLDPLRMPADELAEATRDYRLIHIRRTAPTQGSHGPNDLVWLWPVALLGLLLLLVLFRRRR